MKMLNNHGIAKFISCAAVYLLCFTNTTFANYSWKQRADFGGNGRTAPGSFSINGKGYISGGYDMTTNRKDLWEYDPSTNVWTQMADFGGAGRHGPATFALGGKGYMGLGTITYPNYTFVSDWWEYDPVANTWSQKGNFPGTARYIPINFTIGSKGYMGTGWNQANYFRDFWEYDPSNDTWTQKANFGGTVRVSAIGFVVNGKGYAGTGYDGGSKSDFWEYDPVTNVWTAKANFPAPARYGATAFVINGEAYAGSGGNGTVFYNDFYKYDPVGNSWTPIASFTGVGRRHTGAFGIGNSGFVGTGSVLVGPVTNTFYEYGPDTVHLTPSQTNVNCFGESTGEASVVASGGVGGYTYLWSPGGETTDAITGLAAGSYSVTVTDANGTSASQSFQITEPTSAVGVSINGDLSFCTGGSTTLTANASGGTGSNYGYSWSSGETSQSISASSATTYSVTVTDENGCTSSTQESVSENQLPSCSVSGNLTVCQGNTTQLCAPAGLDSYLWNTGATTQCVTVPAGNYSVSVSDQSGCSSSCNETVATGNGTSCSISGNTTVCSGGTTSLCATAGASYLWNTGATTQCVTVGVGNYSVTVTDNGGCTSPCNASVTDGGGNCCNGFRTQTQGGWGALCKGANPGCYMTSHFASTFPAPNYLTVGCGGGFTVKLTSAQAITDFLPSGGVARALISSLVNPGGGYSNVLAGQLVAATLNVQFDLADPNFSAASSNLQNLVILTGTFTGMTVGQVITEANNFLGGCPSQYTASQLNVALTAINQNYDNGNIDNGFLGCNGASARFINGNGAITISNLETVVYPNPFYERTNIHIMAHENGNVKLEVYNVAGLLVEVLFEGQMNSGEAKDLEFNGSEMTDAIYYYRITSGSQIMNGRLILIK